MEILNYIKPAIIQSRQTGNIFGDLSLQNNLVPAEKNNFDVAILGIVNDVNGTQNKGSAKAPDDIREALYALKGNFSKLYISDLGNFNTTSTRETYFAIEEVIPYLISKRVIPIIIGGSQDYTLPLFRALKESIHKINLVCVDQSLDANNNEDFDHKNYLNPILRSDHLQSFSLMAHQNYFYDDKLAAQYDTFPKNLIRLGELRKHIHRTEPVLRDADMVSIDMSAVRLSDSPGCNYGSPNGLFSEELCQIARFCGFSDRIKLFSLFETNPEMDMNRQSVQLAAQTIWHFIDGLDKRYKDYPLRDISTYKKIIVQQSDIDHELVFYNNPLNNRWWIEINAEKNIIVSCSIDDYHYAKANKIPDVYYKWRRQA